MDRMDRFGDRRLAVHDAEDPLRRGRRALRGRDHAAHRIQPHVETADVGQKERQRADRQIAAVDLPDAHDPDHEQAGVGQQRDHRPEERPQPIDAVVGVQHAVVGAAEAFHLAPLLGKGLDHADAGNGVGQHAGHVGPGPAAQLETAPQPGADLVDQVGDQRQRHERGQGQTQVDRQQYDGRHQDHQHVGGKIEQMDREEVLDAVRVGADPRNQVAGPLSAKELQRHPLQVGIGLVAEVGGNPLADPGDNVGPGPAQ